MILGAIAIVLAQRLEKKESKIIVYAITGLLIFLVGLSRIYVGVHYPTDVLSGFILAFGLLNAVYPTYDRIRFEWRFQSKKKYAVLNCIFLLDNQDLSYKNIILLLMYKNIVFKTNILLKKH